MLHFADGKKKLRPKDVVDLPKDTEQAREKQSQDQSGVLPAQCSFLFQASRMEVMTQFEKSKKKATKFYIQ